MPQSDIVIIIMETYKTKYFVRWADKEKLDDDALCQAIQEVIDGLVDADLGGGLVKKRIAAKGRGKRSSYRTLLAFKSANRAVFLFGFGKNERANVNAKEKKALKLLAKQFLEYGAAEIKIAVQKGVLIRVKCDDKTKT